VRLILRVTAVIFMQNPAVTGTGLCYKLQNVLPSPKVLAGVSGSDFFFSIMEG